MEKEKHTLNFKNKKEFYETFLSKFAHCNRRTIEDMKYSLIGSIKVSEIAVHSKKRSATDDQKIEIATLKTREKIFGDTYELSGLLYNPILEKVGFLDTKLQLDLSTNNTQLRFEPAKPKSTNDFLKYLKKLKLNEDEYHFFSEFPAHFNNPSFGIVEDEPGDVHRMIYADKIPIGVYHFEDNYLGLIYNTEKNVYELGTRKFHQVDYETLKVKYVEAEGLTQSMFSCFGRLCKYAIDKEGTSSSSIFGYTRTKAISILSADQPTNENLQIILGVGVKTHLKHQERTHMQYRGFAFNQLIGRVGNMQVFTERHYTSLGKMTLQSKVEYLPDNPEKRKLFTYELEEILEKEDVEFFQKHVIPYFANLTLGKNVAVGKFTLCYPVRSDGKEIGNYLVNTNLAAHNYRGLMVLDTEVEPPHYLNSIYEFKGKYLIS